MRIRSFTTVVVAIAGLGACDGMGMDDAAIRAVTEAEAPPIDPALAAHLPEGVPLSTAVEGREMFPTCGVCHGMEGEGTALGPSLLDREWIHLQADAGIDEIAALVRSGVPSPSEYPIPMPVLGGGDFNEADVRALATYVYLLSRSGESADAGAGAPTGSAPADSAPPAESPGA